MPLLHLADLPQRYLKPGELIRTEQPAVVTTVLGSCVSVTLFHRLSGSAAICHVLHPRCPRPEACSDHCDAAYRYAPCAVMAMGHWMSARGARPGQIEVKLFGGAAMMARRPGHHAPQSIGRLNVEAALETLEALHLSLKVADVGGTVGRKILFDTGSGEVWLKRLTPVDPIGEAAI